MIRDPDEEPPACPVVATKYKHSANNREEADQANQDEFILKWAVALEFFPVINEPDCAGHYEQPTDDGH